MTTTLNVYDQGARYALQPDPLGFLRWLLHGLDTTSLPDGRYQLTVYAENTRRHIGSTMFTFQTANGVTIAPAQPGQELNVRSRRVRT